MSDTNTPARQAVTAEMIKDIHVLLQQAIQERADKAPRVTQNDVNAAIASEHYFLAGEAAAETESAFNTTDKVPQDLYLLTICVLSLRNGFTVTGESACVSPANFDIEIGRKVARENAINKIWPLLGYELKTKLADFDNLDA